MKFVVILDNSLVVDKGIFKRLWEESYEKKRWKIIWDPSSRKITGLETVKDMILNLKFKGIPQNGT